MLVWPVLASSSEVERPSGATVEAQHLLKAAIEEGLQFCPLCLCNDPRLCCTVHEPG